MPKTRRFTGKLKKNKISLPEIPYRGAPHNLYFKGIIFIHRNDYKVEWLNHEFLFYPSTQKLKLSL